MEGNCGIVIPGDAGMSAKALRRSVSELNQAEIFLDDVLSREFRCRGGLPADARAHSHRRNTSAGQSPGVARRLTSTALLS
jgi:hypothetical protein